MSRAGAELQTHPHNEAHTDSVRISLLTCDAGDEIYSLFGHTAIRYENLTSGTDIVFNYGLFSFDTPHFALRFALGETDYRLGATDTERFIAEYAFLGRGIKQQTLNLNREEKERIAQKLEVNLRPENRTYRYNYFSDNCSTRPLRLIADAIASSPQSANAQELFFTENFTDRNTGVSFRDMLHKYTRKHPWSRLGMDMCIGYGGDREISRSEMTFVPFYVEQLFAQAVILTEDGGHRPLVSSTSTLLTSEERINSNSFSALFTPMNSALLLLALVTLATLYGIRQRKSLWILDCTLFLAAGVAGGILAFLACFSQHPMVDKNLLLLVFHPLHILMLPFMARRMRKNRICRYLFINAALALTLIGIWILHIQGINPAVLPILLAFIVRTAGHAILIHKRKPNYRISERHK